MTATMTVTSGENAFVAKYVQWFGCALSDRRNTISRHISSFKPVKFHFEIDVLTVSTAAAATAHFTLRRKIQFSQLWMVACMGMCLYDYISGSIFCIFVLAPFKVELDDNYFPGTVHAKWLEKTTKKPQSICAVREYAKKWKRQTRTPHVLQTFLWQKWKTAQQQLWKRKHTHRENSQQEKKKLQQ